MKTLINKLVAILLVVLSFALSLIVNAQHNLVVSLKESLRVEKEYNSILRSDMYLLEISNMSYQRYIEEERQKGNIYEIKTIEKN